MHYTAELLPDQYVMKHWVLNPRGARRIAVAAICDHTGQTLSIGHAICNPTDEYDPERGKFIAEGRAVKAWFLRQNSEG